MNKNLHSPVLQDDERFALMKFRRSVSDILKPEHDDHFLLRWLRARQWNPENAEKMLRESMEWRKKWSVDELDKYIPPAVFKDYIPHGTTGFDKEGSPIIIIPFSGIDVWGILHSAEKVDIVKNTIRLLESFMKIAYKQSLDYGPEARKFTVIFDMDNFSMKQYAYRPAAELVITTFQMYSNNYPEILKYCYVINAPKIFSFAFNIVKKFLDEYTISKIKIYKQNPIKWIPAILERIDETNLPKYYGGALTDKDGNPKCLEKICWGGKIPKEFYISSEANYNSSSSYCTVIIKKGSKLKLTFNAETEGVFLKWEFRAHNHDIKFGVKAVNNQTKEKISAIDLKRISSNESHEIGFITCIKDHTYTVVFDNSYSYFKSKKITYSVVMMETPLEEIEKGARKIEEKLLDENKNNLPIRID
ncbi:CLUMA_CG006247, isoform A [Clunio marinus]|uniref:CLUMA_CG006247, isoform A n=1 Tax=Clunio marinus TaxID=568069 RepID=A0A1J1HXB2_9DIPT|nr:CLUMA_CG006247, isoform A [Clunio marinus]